MNVLEVNNLKKRLGKRKIIKNVSFSVKKGEIFGFLGPNGAGKTTTIRMLVGLIAPNSGSITIMGHDIKKERELALKNVGAVVENPELYNYLSGKENLMQVARIRKISKERVDEVIELVQLTPRINDRVKKYSLGMKQRLGLALALLSNPSLLILDEPTNGLDPSGIIDFRQIVKKAARETGTAVFVSSHILAEVQQLCDTVAFINNGVIKSVESLNKNEEKNIVTVKLITKEVERASAILNMLSFVTDFSSKENTFSIKTTEESISKIVFALAEHRIPINEIFKSHHELEERYMQLVEGGIR